MCQISPLLAQTDEFDYQQLESQINKTPWIGYQKLLEQERFTASWEKNKQLEFLLRKAQAENLLYFYDEFNQTVAQAFQLIDNNTVIEIKSNFFYLKGLIDQRDGSYDKAVSSYQQAVDLTNDTPLFRINIVAMQELAYAKSLTNLYIISLTKIREAYLKASKLNDPFLLAIINESYGAIYGFLGNYESSIEHYELALAGYKALEYSPYVAEAIYGLASTYRYSGKYQLATEFFNLYNESISYTPNSDVTFFGLYGLGMTLAEKGDCQKAISIIDNALAIKGANDYYAELYKRKSSCEASLGLLKEAQESLKLAKDIFKTLPELEGTTWELETLKIDSQIAYSLKDFKSAYDLASKYFEQHSKILTFNSAENLSMLRSSFELESRDAKIRLLQQQAKVQMLEAEQHLQHSVKQKYKLSFAMFVIFLAFVALFLQRKHTKKILAISIRDSLSGLYNRRYIFSLFDKMVGPLQNRKAKLSIILLDIDDFKVINDKYGHPFGDTVIKTVSEICQATLRSEDAMGRIGGEEFLCLLPRISEQDCMSIANRMLKNVANHTFLADKKEDFRITISIGIATSSETAKTRRDMIIHADKALYHSKESGKNQITCFDSLQLDEQDTTN